MVYLSVNSKLRTISENAFDGPILNAIKHFWVQGTYNLQNSSQTLFAIINKMPNIIDINIESNNLTEVPDNAIKPLNGYNNSIKGLAIVDEKLKTIGNNAFKYLSNLTSFGFGQTIIRTFPENAFKIDPESKNKMNFIFLGNEEVKQANIPKNIFTKFNRLVHIIFDNVHDKYIDESLFVPFFKAHNTNSLDVYTRLDCDDCRSYWAYNQSSYAINVWNECTNGLEFNDFNNFKHCH